MMWFSGIVKCLAAAEADKAKVCKKKSDAKVKCILSLFEPKSALSQIRHRSTGFKLLC